MNNVKIGNKIIGKGNCTFVIAEIGINHNGDINIAKQLIKHAFEAGCDAVKFQKRTIDVVYTKEELSMPRETTFGTTNGELKNGLEFCNDEYAEIDRYCKELGIIWFASPWDEEAVDFIENFNVACYKLASASLTDDNLLKHVRSKHKPIILSVGMSTEDEIKHAVEILGENELILLHTVSTYPAKIENLNLNAMKTLIELYPDVPIGYSGHERELLPSIAAVAMGACVIERHFTLDKTMWGSDQSASIEPQEMKKMICDIRSVEKAMGRPEIQCLEEEIPIKKKLRRK